MTKASSSRKGVVSEARGDNSLNDICLEYDYGELCEATNNFAES